MNSFIRRQLGKVQEGRKWLNQSQRWPFILAASIVWGITIWQIYRTDFLAGFWGITNDEIAVITIEMDDSNNDGTSTETIVIQDPSKSFWLSGAENFHEPQAEKTVTFENSIRVSR